MMAGHVFAFSTHAVTMERVARANGVRKYLILAREKNHCHVLIAGIESRSVVSGGSQVAKRHEELLATLTVLP